MSKFLEDKSHDFCQWGNASPEMSFRQRNLLLFAWKYNISIQIHLTFIYRGSYNCRAKTSHYKFLTLWVQVVTHHRSHSSEDNKSGKSTSREKVKLAEAWWYQLSSLHTQNLDNIASSTDSKFELFYLSFTIWLIMHFKWIFLIISNDRI